MKINICDYSLAAIRYAAYAQTDKAGVHIKMADKNTAEIFFSVKPGKKYEAIENSFLQELRDEKIREKSRKANIAAYLMIIKKTLRSFCLQPEGKEAVLPALSKEQEQDLDNLIAEVEKELQMEMESSSSSDSDNITKTWEEINGKK